jgi:hypothetical protein
MPYNDETTFPRGLYYNDLTADRDVALAAHGATAHPVRVAWIQLSNADAAAARIVKITDTDDNNLAVLIVPLSDSLEPIPGFYSSNGLKVAMDTNDADVHVTVAYLDD